jgi:hypothetical protein
MQKQSMGGGKRSDTLTWLYLARRSLRHGAPVLIWPVASPTAKSAMKESSVSPLRCDAITPQFAFFDMFTASMDSVTVPIWFTCSRASIVVFVCLFVNFGSFLTFKNWEVWKYLINWNMWTVKSYIINLSLSLK